MPNCECCGAATYYRLVVATGKAVPCCGRFRCEEKLRDGVDVPDTHPRANTIEMREALYRLRSDNARLREALEEADDALSCRGCAEDAGTVAPEAACERIAADVSALVDHAHGYQRRVLADDAECVIARLRAKEWP